MGTLRKTVGKRILFHMIGMMYPISTLLFCYAMYRFTVFIYGGPDEFRRIIFEEPMQGKLYQKNPAMLWRDKPSVIMPEHITGLSLGDTRAAAKERQQDY